MGYCVTMMESNFKILLNNTNIDMDRIKEIESELEQVGYEVTIEDNIGITDIKFHGEKYSSTAIELFNVIAKYVVNNSYIQYCGEDGEIFRLKFSDGMALEIYPKLTWEE